MRSSNRVKPEITRACAYVVADSLRQRRRWGAPIPLWMVDLDRALRVELSAAGQDFGTEKEDQQRWISAEELAAQMGVTPRTVRRHAARYAGLKVGGAWIFPT
jgi:hypothetical protein